MKKIAGKKKVAEKGITDKWKRTEKQGVGQSIFWLKGFAVFLAVMLFFTIVSRVAASFTVPRVTVAEVGSGKIGHDVVASGMIKAAGECAVCTLPDLLVSQVSVHTGERVEEGDLLFTVDPEQLEEQITELDGQMVKLRLENEAAEKNREQEAKKQQIEVQRAKEDYKDAVSRQEKAEKKRTENLQAAEEEKQRAGEALNVAITAKNQAEDAYNRAVKELEDAQADNKVDNEQESSAGQNTVTDNSNENWSEQNQASEKVENAVQKSQNQSDQLTGLQEIVQQKKADLEACEANVTEKKAAYDTSVEQWNTLQETAGAESSAEDDTVKAAARAVENALLAEQADHTAEINAITLKQYEKQLADLKALSEQNGEVRAEAAGTVTKVLVETGQKTTDTAAVLLSDEQEGLLFTASVDKQFREYLSAGVTAELSGSGRLKEECTISAIETAEDGQTVRIMAELSGDTFTPGESAAITVSGKSDSYDSVVPATAIREENQKKYVLLLDTESTILGEQYVARKVEVEVLDKNGTYAAVSSGALSGGSQIIVDANRNVGAGDIVRLEAD